MYTFIAKRVTALAALLALSALGVGRAGASAPDAATVFPDNSTAALSETVKSAVTDSYGTTTTLSYIGNESDAVPALLVVPSAASSAAPAPCLLLIHGIGGSKEQMLPIARILSNLGYASLTIDLPGFGARAGEAQQTFKSADDLSRYVASTLTRSVTDLRRGIDLLAANRSIDSKRIAVIGISLGSFVGVDLAAADPRVKSAALVAAGGGLENILAFQASKGLSYGGAQSALAGQLKKSKNAQSTLKTVDPLTYISEIAPRPILMENGAEDTVIPPSAARALYAAAGQPKHMDVYAGQGHIPSPIAMYAPLSDFLGRTLNAGTAPENTTNAAAQ